MTWMRFNHWICINCTHIQPLSACVRLWIREKHISSVLFLNERDLSFLSFLMHWSMVDSIVFLLVFFITIRFFLWIKEQQQHQQKLLLLDWATMLRMILLLLVLHLSLSLEEPSIDPNGYVMFCPCMGNIRREWMIDGPSFTAEESFQVDLEIKRNNFSVQWDLLIDWIEL